MLLLLLFLTAWSLPAERPAPSVHSKSRGPPQRPRTTRGFPAQRREKAEGQARQGSQ